MAAEGGDSKIAILAALGANAGIMIAKFIGAFITGSSSMLAEAVHSVADTGNEALLLVGRNRAEQAPDVLHPFGYTRNRYFYSFVVALVLFTMGCLFALNEAVHKIRFPHELESPGVAIAILLVSMLLEGFSFRTARRESVPLKGKHSWWHFIRNSRNPELPVVLLEDMGALIGLMFALAGVGLTVLTGNGVWDGVGTLLIGLLLGFNAIVLIVETKSLIIGEGATAAEDRAIRGALLADPRIVRVLRLQTQYLGPEDLLVNAKIAMQADLDISRVGAAIDAADARIRDAAPSVRTVYLEPDVFRPEKAGATGSHR
ncbi:cation diffusion facilitator family transporter [Nocardia caishijiensis]|uniref:Cation diffusion facilitator family transporter n=1 Tax=Nocardia caishijiensis TaxID=184756 RepID=A0ABQ6YKE4_9NOCA|nr:cation diffusion facilitator family transporter [Nocardia caishijiensis]KAF0846257.1 cation diffusion facilitator family transporter [Nocardia caishijiensis]